MKIGKLPSRYLGIPFFEGACRTNLWKDLIDSGMKKMKGC